MFHPQQGVNTGLIYFVLPKRQLGSELTIQHEPAGDFGSSIGSLGRMLSSESRHLRELGPNIPPNTTAGCLTTDLTTAAHCTNQMEPLLNASRGSTPFFRKERDRCLEFRPNEKKWDLIGSEHHIGKQTSPGVSL